MKENTVVVIPFRLRTTAGAYVNDAVLANYDIEIYKNATLYVVTPTIVYLGTKGRHLLVFTGSTQDQYQLFIDHNAHRPSIESAWVYLDKYDTIDLKSFIDAGASPTSLADAVWNAVATSYSAAGSMGAFLKRILQLQEPDVVVDQNANTIVLKDRTTGEVLVSYNITGIINTDITHMDG